MHEVSLGARYRNLCPHGAGESGRVWMGGPGGLLTSQRSGTLARVHRHVATMSCSDIVAGYAAQPARSLIASVQLVFVDQQVAATYTHIPHPAGAARYCIARIGGIDCPCISLTHSLVGEGREVIAIFDHPSGM